ncbi:primase-helicase family protein [Ruegeria profundi]|uniref:primase-helicase family protein n=1 Tax=Ruegeria profundi TaxID=1685378 RepID=UPI001CD64880|nr:primase-helicase family protein [Ruegeria profundi]MCA0929754.1 DUF5906 domain-containing protein [Ruegeria profundi]
MPRNFPTSEEVLKYMNGRYAVVTVGNKVRIAEMVKDPDLGITRVRFYDPASFKLKYSHKMVELISMGPDDPNFLPWGEFWLNNMDRAQFEGVTFDPANRRNDQLNLWQGFAARPIKGNLDPFLNFVETIICSGDQIASEFILSYFAHMVQRPWELPESAIVLLGGQGVGKSFFVRQMGSLLPDHFVHLTQVSHLVGSFNSHLAQAVVIFGDEGSFATKRASAVLKGRITEPTYMMEQKGIDALPMRNYARVIVASNDPHVIHAQGDERRFCVLEVSNQKQGDTKYFGDLWQFMLDGGRDALMHFLKTREISDFDPRTPPKTKALAEQKILSMSDIEKWFFEVLHRGDLPKDTGFWPVQVPCRSVVRDYENFCWDVGQCRRSAETQVGKYLHKLLPGLRIVRPGGGERQYVLPSLAECRAAFDRAMRSQTDWPVYDED